MMEKVNYSKWAAPVVPVSSEGRWAGPNFGDYKVMVNPALQEDQYPLPKLDNLFASLVGRERF